MSPIRSVVAGVGLLTVAMLSPMTQADAQTRIDQLRATTGVTIQGRITDTFGNKFVLEDSSGRILVESGPHWYHQFQLRPGERVSVLGRPDGGGFDAFAITREDGTVIQVRPSSGPPPWSGAGRERQRPGPRADAARFQYTMTAKEAV